MTRAVILRPSAGNGGEPEKVWARPVDRRGRPVLYGPTGAPISSEFTPTTDQGWTLRRWEAAETTRLNLAHWAKAVARPINVDLKADLANLRARCAYEVANNPIVEGMISTHATDLIGHSGPTLQVQYEGEDREYEEQLEAAWLTWWEDVDRNGEVSGSDMLEQWIRMWWLTGEMLAQIVTEGEGDEAKTKLLNLHPSRLSTPTSAVGDQKIVMGVERDKYGKPLKYHVTGADGQLASVPDPIDAEYIIHEFRRLEPGQARGVPWLACVLPTVADLRDYDAQVLDAARAAADHGVLLHTNHPDSEFFNMSSSESYDIERRRMVTLPPGWDATQMTPQQPSTTYGAYRKERHLDLGRPVNMPGMIVRLDSSGHNYSSARFDNQLYHRGNIKIEGWIERRILNRLVKLVEREARLAKEITAQRPPGVRNVWTWPVPPHVDPSKEAKAEQTRLESGTLSLSMAAAAHGISVDELIAQRQRDNERLVKAGLPAVGTGGTQRMTFEPADEKEEPENDRP